MNGRMWRAALVAGTMAGFGLWAAPASAQATRTWVSGVGDDMNSCSRTAPCKTFAGAIGKTATGGEISCLDPGGYGSVTITKSLSIVCDATEASILASGTNGITVNGAGIVVYLSGLNIFAVNGTNPAANDGVVVLNAGSVVLDNVKIRNFGGYGVRFEPTAAASLTVRNALVSSSGTAGNLVSGGILARPASGIAGIVTVSGSVVANNQGTGLRLETQGGSTISASIVDTVVSNSTNGLFFRAQTGAGTINATVNGVTTTNNSGYGLIGTGTGLTLRVGNSTITANGTGVAALGSAAVTSFGDNRLLGNTTNGTFPTVTPKQ